MIHDPSRSTPAGYWRLSKEYYLAARAVQTELPRLLAPTLQLYGQSLELALKAFLLKRGVTLSQVEALRHRLSDILRLSRIRRLGTEVKLGAADIALINLLSDNYSRHRFRYIVTGFTRLPEPQYIASICERVVGGLERYCTGLSWGISRHGA